jgi:hypothetical protein
LSRLCGFADITQLQQAYGEWVSEALRQEHGRDERWSEALAVGSSGFVAKVKEELGVRGTCRDTTEMNGTFTLREAAEAYSDVFAVETDVLRLDNQLFWEDIPARTAT